MLLDRRVTIEAYSETTNEYFEVVGAELEQSRTIWAHREKADEVMEQPDPNAGNIRLANVGKRRYTIRPAPFLKELGKVKGFRHVYLVDEDGERWYVQEIEEVGRRRWWTVGVQKRETTNELEILGT